MAIRHILLVYLPYIVSEKDTKDIQKEKAASYAQTVLKRFNELVYTKALHSPFNGGDSNILLCSEDKRLAMQELERVLDFQRSEIMYCLERMKDDTGKPFDNIIRDLYSDADAAEHKCSLEYIRCVSQFLAGEYQMSSRFYNTWEKTARLLPKDIEALKKSPDHWALVTFMLER